MRYLQTYTYYICYITSTGARCCPSTVARKKSCKNYLVYKIYKYKNQNLSKPFKSWSNGNRSRWSWTFSVACHHMSTSCPHSPSWLPNALGPPEACPQAFDVPTSRHTKPEIYKQKSWNDSEERELYKCVATESCWELSPNPSNPWFQPGKLSVTWTLWVQAQTDAVHESIWRTAWYRMTGSCISLQYLHSRKIDETGQLHVVKSSDTKHPACAYSHNCLTVLAQNIKMPKWSKMK